MHTVHFHFVHVSNLCPPDEFKSNIYAHLAQYLVSITENILLFCY